MDSSIAQWLEPKMCAVLVVDMQNDYCSADGILAREGKDITTIREMIPRLAEFIGHARKAGVQIAFTQNTTLPEGLSDTPTRRHFRTKTRPGVGAYPLRGTWGHEISDDLEVGTDDFIIEKFRPSAFYGTSLNMLFRANDIGTVLVCGTATEGCVDSTVRDAANYDYLPVVIDDCVTSSKSDLHEASLKVMAHRYNAISSDDLIEGWSL